MACSMINYFVNILLRKTFDMFHLCFLLSICVIFVTNAKAFIANMP